MSEHEVRTREEWLAARTALLGEEKELTRRSDELARKRQALPWVPVEKGYRFETEDGTKALPDLFDGRSQLLVYHFMFGDRRGLAGCGLSGLLVHRGQPRRRRRASPAAGRDLRRRLACPAREPAGVQAPDGLELPVGLGGGKRLQPRLRRVHGGGAKDRHRLQLRDAEARG
jgi:Bacterial protein of unknown function (DUF899)